MFPLYLGLFSLSTAVLLLEVGLTRIFAMTQWYHFAFLAVSLALLGFGAGGSLHMAIPGPGRPRDSQRGPPLRLRGILAALSALFAVACGGTLLAGHLLPLDLYTLAWDRRQFFYLAGEYAALVPPFLLAGLTISMLLQAHPDRAGPLYACNLAGSALGTLLAPLLLGLLGANRLPLTAGLMAAIAAGVFLLPGPKAPDSTKPTGARQALPFLAIPLIALLLYLLMYPPAVLSLRMDPHKSLVQQLRFPAAHQVYSQENAVSRVDVVADGPYHSFPGLPLIPSGPLPPQMALTLDGDQPSPLTLFQPGHSDSAFLHSMLTALPYQLHPQARTLLVEPMGGLDLLQALEQQADQVVVLEKNPLVAKVVKTRFSDEIGGIFRLPSVRLEQIGARSYLARPGPAFDLISFALTGERAVVTAGAYSLTEEDLLTVEAFQAALRRLAPGGTLAVMRWLQQPPSEELRTLSTMVAALQEEGVPDPREHLLAVRSWSTLLLLSRREPFSGEEIALVKQFCEQRRFDLVWLPGLARDEANRFSRILEGPIYYDTFHAFLEAEDRQAFYRSWPADVRPARDEQPFFYNFFRWQQLPQVLQQVGQTVQPFAGAGFLVLPLFLALALVSSAVLIVLPAALSRRRARRSAEAAGTTGWGGVLFYFAALGLGFMGIEIPLLGRFTLFLDQPLYATAGVLFALLVGSGLGSLLGERRGLRRGSPRASDPRDILRGTLRLVLGILAGLGIVYALGLPPLLRALLGLPLVWRMLVGVGLLLPLGFLMGIPFPVGVRLLGEGRQTLIPWAWAVNGCASVLGAIGAQIASLSWGYRAVLLAGAACYGLAWLAGQRLRPRSLPTQVLD